MYIIFIIAFVSLVCGLIARWISSPSRVGKMGERIIADLLDSLPDDYHVFNDVMLQTRNGTAQLDHLVVSVHGIFVIETKNYRGEIYGDDNREEWTQMIVTDVTYRSNPFKTYTYVTKNNFYNPVKQSLGHKYAVSHFLRDYPHLPVVPLVVFVGDSCIGGVESKHHVITDRELVQVIRSYRNIYLSDVDLKKIVERFLAIDVGSAEMNKEHVRNVYEAKNRKNATVNSGICPKCGGALVVRNGKYGTFWGCKNYPSCKFTCR